VNELLQPCAVHRQQHDSVVARDRFAAPWGWFWLALLTSAASAGSWQPQFDLGVRARSSGDIYQSVEILTQAVDRGAS
jgi:hypothetical protein